MEVSEVGATHLSQSHFSKAMMTWGSPIFLEASIYLASAKHTKNCGKSPCYEWVNQL